MDDYFGNDSGSAIALQYVNQKSPTPRWRLSVSDIDFENTQSEYAEASNCDLVNTPNPVFGSIMIALVVVGLIGNSLVFFTILVLHEYKKSVTNWYILQLTLADTLFLLMLPFTAHSEVVGRWEFSLSLCKFKEAVIFINYYASIYFLVIMSFDRFLAVTKAFDSRKWLVSLRSPTASYVISAIGWIVSALLCVQLYRYSRITDCQTCEYLFPEDKVNQASSRSREDLTYHEALFHDYFYSNRLHESGISFDEFFDCLTNNNSNSTPTDCLGKETVTTFTCRIVQSKELHIWIYGNFAGAFLLPFVLICYFYGMIMKQVRSASLVESNAKQRSYRRRVTMIVFALVSLFAISWLPWYVEKLVKIQGINLNSDTCVLLSNAVRGIAYMNSAFNPYFYSFLGFHFRDRLKQAGSRVRLVMSMSSRSYRTSSMRKRNNYNSSSNSIGVRMNQNGYAGSKGSTRMNGNHRGGMTKVGPKTERTEV